MIQPQSKTRMSCHLFSSKIQTFILGSISRRLQEFISSLFFCTKMLISARVFEGNRSQSVMGCHQSSGTETDTDRRKVREARESSQRGQCWTRTADVISNHSTKVSKHVRCKSPTLMTPVLTPFSHMWGTRIQFLRHQYWLPSVTCEVQEFNS